MAEGDVLLSVEGLQLTLGGKRILDGVSFQVTDRVRPGEVTGQIVSLLGPSGVGKTRTLRIIAGLDQADAGQVRGEGGRELSMGSVGVVFQNYPLLRHRTVLDNLVVAGLTAGQSGADARKKAEELLARFDLADRGDLYPAQLSGGQRQRAAIAQQLMNQRQLLILDEPFSGLDPAALLEVVGLLVEVAHMDEANTLIIVTHDIRAAMLASDLLFMLGRDLDAKGKPGGGAKVKRTYDLFQLGLAWRADVESDPRFAPLEKEIKDAFRTL